MHARAGLLSWFEVFWGHFLGTSYAQGWERGFLSHLRVSHTQDSVSLTVELSTTAAR